MPAESGMAEKCDELVWLALVGECHRLPASDLAVVGARWVLPRSSDYRGSRDG